MTHDSMCLFKNNDWFGNSCPLCDILVRVRADERAKPLVIPFIYANADQIVDMMIEVRAAAFGEAVAAIKTLHDPWILREPRQDGVSVLCAYCQTQFDAPYPCDTVKTIEALSDKVGDDK